MFYLFIYIFVSEKPSVKNIARPVLSHLTVSQAAGNSADHQRSVSNHSSSNIAHQTSSTNSSGGNRNVSCPICEELVGASRFAYHLEKCMNGGKRGTRKHYDYLHDEVMERPKPKKEFVDPHPNSMIVKIKLKNGGNPA